MARIKGAQGVTAPFSLEEVRSTLLMLRNHFGGIHVDVRESESEKLVTLRYRNFGFISQTGTTAFIYFHVFFVFN